MKLIVAVVRAPNLEGLYTTLHTADIEAMTACEVMDYGAKAARTEIYRGAEYAVSFAPKMKIEVMVADERVGWVVDVLSASGGLDDARICILDVEQVLRSRIGDDGSATRVRLIPLPAVCHA